MRTHPHSKRAVASPVPTILGVLLGLLILSSVLFVFGREDARVLPSASNVKPTGMAVLAELLRQQGYEVSVDPSFRPTLPKDAIVIECQISSQDFWFSPENSKTVSARVGQFVRGGGTLISIFIPRDANLNAEELRRSEPTDVKSSLGRAPIKYRARISTDAIEESSEPGAPVLIVDTMQQEKQTLCSIHNVGKGFVIQLGEGSFLTNRFLDDADHAPLALSLVRLANPKAKKVIFVEGSLLNVQPSLWQEIGPWASVAYWQVFLLCAVIVFTLGRRFGPPISDQVHVRGSRELLDAFGDLMRRAKRANLALELLHGNLDLRVRRATNLPTHADEKDRNARLSPELVTALHQLRSGSQDEINTKQAAALAKTALRLVEQLESEARSRRAGI